jgi:hypothetical protein
MENGFVGYAECSAITVDGVDDVFRASAIYGLDTLFT